MDTILTRRWTALAASLENVPAFWAVYALILVETVGEGVLAIPIAVAKIGPLAGIGVLIVIGVVNMITIASIAEASARNGSIRYGGAYLGRVVQDYLGSTGTFVLVLGVTAIQLLALISYYVGFSTTMAEATRMPAAAWAAAIFLVCFYFLRKGSFASTTALVLLIGGINVGTILLLSLLSIPHIQLGNILHTSVSFSVAKAFDPSLLQLVFGVISSAYLGHLGVANSAQVALRRDTSAQSLIWGSVAAQATLILIYCLWVIVVNGAVTSSVLANQSGTALVPLASQIGPLSYVLGSLLIFLGIGVASIVTALGLFCLVREWLPKSLFASVDPPPAAGSHRDRSIRSAWAFLAVCESCPRRFRLRGMAVADRTAVVYHSSEFSWRPGRAAHCRSISCSSARGQPSKGRQTDAMVSWVAGKSPRDSWYLRGVCDQPLCSRIFHLARPGRTFCGSRRRHWSARNAGHPDSTGRIRFSIGH